MPQKCAKYELPQGRQHGGRGRQVGEVACKDHVDRPWACSEI